ncbi:hypothetical protein [Burkholderia sp. BCC1988]|uniref:hypothetical protein n=1 Tax=Burkholderia sp. BCC1988 TaxID=2817443 RepID=UPI002AB2ED86|nr:hypothetical protein [Burkholderia sp. BCC1988]
MTRKVRPRRRVRAAVKREDAFLREMVAVIACPFDGLAPDSREAIDSAAERFRSAVHLLLKRHFGEAGPAAVSAYDTGIAIGLFGEQSAIAEGIRSRGTAQSAQRSHQSVYHKKLFRAVLEGGRLHGRCIRDWGLPKL